MDIRRYQYKSPPPSKQSLDQLSAAIEDNLAEMKKIVDQVNEQQQQCEWRRRSGHGNIYQATITLNNEEDNGISDTKEISL
ncbi:MAG: hypothetical protein R6U91_07050 [Bacillota bacterium]